MTALLGGGKSEPNPTPAGAPAPLRSTPLVPKIAKKAKAKRGSGALRIKTGSSGAPKTGLNIPNL